MQNDMLKNTIAPWQEKGRWYHGIWNFSTASMVAGSDQYLLDTGGYSDSGNTIYFYDKTKKIEYINVVTKTMSDYSCSLSSTITGVKRYYTTGEIGIPISTSNAYNSGHMEVWLFGVER